MSNLTFYLISLGKLLGSLECDCPLKCETIHYEVQLSSSSYPSRHLLPILARRLINESLLDNVTDETWSEIEAMVRYAEIKVKAMKNCHKTHLGIQNKINDCF